MHDGEDDDGGRMHRRGRGPGRESDLTSQHGAGHERVPGKSTLSSRLPFATRGAAAQNAVLLARGAVARVLADSRALMDAIASANYAESARLSFEVRSALRRAETGLADLEGNDPSEAARIADQIQDARDQLRSAQRDVALLLRASPVLEDPRAGSAEAEHEWTRARASASPQADTNSRQPNAEGEGWDKEAAAIAGSLGLGAVAVRDDDGARGITDAKGARGVALGDTVYMHPERARAGSPEGREVLAHELVHLAQARLPRRAGGGRAAAEREAASLAPLLVRGAASPSPQHYIDLSVPAGDVDADEAATKPVEEPTLPPGVDFQVIDGADGVFADRLWLTGSERGQQMRPGRMAVVLKALRAAGRLAWADAGDIEALSRVPMKLSISKSTTVVRVDLAAAAYFALGLPPGATTVVSARGDGLEIVTRFPGLPPDAADGHYTLDEEASADVIRAIEAAVGIAVSAQGGAQFTARQFRMAVRHGAMLLWLDGNDCRTLFEVEQWDALVKRSREGNAALVAARGTDAAPATSQLAPEEREWLERWCAENLSKGALGGSASVTAYQLLRRIDASEARAAILGHLRADFAADKPIDEAALERAIYGGEVDAARKSAGLDPEVSGTRDADPLFKVPLPARIVPHATEILDGDSVDVEIVVDWPAEQLSLLDQVARQQTNPFDVEVEWVIQRVDGGDRAVAQTAQLHRDCRFKLGPNETAGTWTVQAFVRSTYFYPAAVTTRIEVKTESARLAELRGEAMGDLGGAQVAQAAHDFDIGLVDDKVSGDADDRGARLTGEMPAGYEPPTDAERSSKRANERETQVQLLAYLERTSPNATDAIDAVKRSIARIDEIEKLTTSDAAGGWRTFQVRGTYLSRDEQVASGPLDLYGTVQYQTRPLMGLKVSGVAVRLRDLSRRFENAAPVYTSFAPTFDAAFENAFVDLCKAYPDGKVSVLAEELSPDGGTPTGKTVGFELGTSSRMERVKEAVWDPAVNVIVNAAAIAMMAFAPYTAPIVFAALAGYNTLRTVDELRELSSRGLLTDHKIKMSMGSIALDILPFAKYAKVVKANEWVRYAVESVDHGGQVALMTHEVRDMAIQLQEQDVMALAEMYRELTELERSTHGHDPQLKKRRQEIEERAREVGKRGFEAFSQVAGTRGLFMVASHQFQQIAAKAHGSADSEPGARAEVAVDDVAPGPRVTLIGTDEQLRAQLALVRVQPGVLDVVVHGTMDDFFVHTDAGVVSISNRSLAKKIRSSGKKYTRVRLLSCDAGKHAKGAAQHLANQLGVPVEAAADKIWVHEDGDISTGPSPHHDTRAWLVFTPKSSERRYTLAKEVSEPTVRDRRAGHTREEGGIDGTALSMGSAARGGVPIDVPIDRSEIRAFIAEKYANIVEKYVAAPHTRHAEYEDLLAELRQYEPGSLGELGNAERARDVLARWVAIAKQIEARTGHSESDLRELYNLVEKQDMPIWLRAVEHLPKAEQARLMHMLREELRVFVRDLMTDENSKEVLYLRDLAVSGRRAGPAFDKLVEKKTKQFQDSDRAFDDIIDGSQRSNRDVNKAITGNERGIKDQQDEGKPQ